jgi:hypothetical protein
MRKDPSACVPGNHRKLVEKMFSTPPVEAYIRVMYTSYGMDRRGSATAGTIKGYWCGLWQSVETSVSMSSTFVC